MRVYVSELGTLDQHGFVNHYPVPFPGYHYLLDVINMIIESGVLRTLHYQLASAVA